MHLGVAPGSVVSPAANAVAELAIENTSAKSIAITLFFIASSFLPTIRPAHSTECGYFGGVSQGEMSPRYIGVENGLLATRDLKKF